MRSKFLADTSAMARAAKPNVRSTLDPLMSSGQIALCSPVAFELGFGARNASDHKAILDGLQAFPSVPVTPGDHQRALEIQGLLAERGAHRALSLVDALVAAVAEQRSLCVLHYDQDFELVAEVTALKQQWVVPPGTADHSAH